MIPDWDPKAPRVPFDGNVMQSYPMSHYARDACGRHVYDESGRAVREGPEWRLLEPFEATLTLVGRERGMSRQTFLWKDEQTGITYPMFASDLFDVIQRATITKGYAFARWVAHKKGTNYGIGAAK